MRIDYAPRAIRDLEQIGAYHGEVAGSRVAAEIADRIERVVARLAVHPGIGPRVVSRPGVRTLLVQRYPYKIFYRVRGETVQILHIRHTARRPWLGR